MSLLLHWGWDLVAVGPVGEGLAWRLEDGDGREGWEFWVFGAVAVCGGGGWGRFDN